MAVMGASGSGKSTFMNILGCLDRLSSGRYSLEGIDVSEHDKNAPWLSFATKSLDLFSKASSCSLEQQPLKTRNYRHCMRRSIRQSADNGLPRP